MNKAGGGAGQGQATLHRDVATTPQEKQSRTRKVRKVSEAEVEDKVKVKLKERGEGVFGNLCPFKSSCSSGHSLLELKLVAAIALTMTMPDSKEASQVGPNTHFDLAVEIAA